MRTPRSCTVAQRNRAGISCETKHWQPWTPVKPPYPCFHQICRASTTLAVATTNGASGDGLGTREQKRQRSVCLPHVVPIKVNENAPKSYYCAAQSSRNLVRDQTLANMDTCPCFPISGPKHRRMYRGDPMCDRGATRWHG